MTAPLNLRVFLSSPGDVAEERKLARHVMQELEGSHLLRGRVRFEILAWDDENASAPMDAGKIPQESVNAYVGRPADCDLTLVILWSRIGSLQPPQLTRPDGSRYESGTVWEQEDAIHARKPVFIYRRTETPQTKLDDPEFDTKRTQYLSVKSFFDRFANPDGSPQAGFNSYAQPPDFARLLRQHLEGFVNERLGGVSALPPVSPDDPKVSQILALIDELTRKNQQLDEKQAQIIQLQQENEHLRRSAIARTLTAAAQPAASAAALEAGEALEVGDPRPAEALLREEERAKAETDRSREAAELAREQGALAFGYDVRAALAAYKRAADYEPEHVWTRLYIGDLELRVGDTVAALESFNRALVAAESIAARDPDNMLWQRDLSVSYDRIGDVLLAQGDGPAALAAYRKGLLIDEALVAHDSTNMGWQRYLAVSQDKIGDVLVSQGEGSDALAFFRRSLAIRESLAARNPSNTEWQRDLSVSHEKIGSILLAQGDAIAALTAYHKSLTLAEVAAAADPANTSSQRDLSVSHNKIGDILMVQGDQSAALVAYRKSLAIRDALISRDPANTTWQRDGSVSHEKIGDGLLAQGERDAALAAYRRSLDIREALAARDPANIEWQRDLSVNYNKVGEVLLVEGDLPSALIDFRKGLAIAEALVLRNPANSGWRRDLSVSYNKVGDVLVRQNEVPAALEIYRKSLAIAERLVALDPTNIVWQRDLSVNHERIGEALLIQGDKPAALAAHRKCLAIREVLAVRDPANILWQTDLVVSYSKLGTLDHDQDLQARRNYLTRGRDILLSLKSQNRLAPAHNWMDWFNEQLKLLQRPAQPSKRAGAAKASRKPAMRKGKRNNKARPRQS